MAFCHMKFQRTPSLIPFTSVIHNFYGLEVSLSMMIGLLCSNNRMVIFLKTDKKFMSQQTRKCLKLQQVQLLETVVSS